MAFQEVWTDPAHDYYAYSWILMNSLVQYEVWWVFFINKASLKFSLWAVLHNLLKIAFASGSQTE